MSSPSTIADAMSRVSLDLCTTRKFSFSTHLSGNVMLDKTKKIGNIEATIMLRGKIPDGYFMTKVPKESSVMGQVGLAVYEPRQGRTKLRSLAPFDKAKSDTMFIEEFHIDEEYKVNGASDVGAAALYQLLRHPNIRNVSSAVYVLDSFEGMTAQERKQEMYKEKVNPFSLLLAVETNETCKSKVAEERRLQRAFRRDADQFLRNGFFQDDALARHSGTHRVVVASCGHWSLQGAKMPVMSHEEAQAVRFHVPPFLLPPTGKDGEILLEVKLACAQGGQLSFQKLQSLAWRIYQLVMEGGSINRSNAVHVAVFNECDSLLLALFNMSESKHALANAKDDLGNTPLMVAALTAAGKLSRPSGTTQSCAISILLNLGADKAIQHHRGWTAYGFFVKMMTESAVKAAVEKGQRFRGVSNTANQIFEIKQLLRPSNGPTPNDVDGPGSGFMDYTEIDRMAGATKMAVDQ